MARKAGRANTRQIGGDHPTFSAKYKVQDDGCWVWRGYINFKDYGYLWAEGKPWAAHRYSYLIHKGEIPKGVQVHHTCDIPSCVNPDHLILGSNKQNVDQKWNERDLSYHVQCSGEYPVLCAEDRHRWPRCINMKGVNRA